jgi:hypothetical protein
MKVLKFGFSVLLCIISYVNSGAQAMVTNSSGVIILNPNERTQMSNLKRGSYEGNHVLGPEVAERMNTFESIYVFYTSEGGAYPVERKNVIKPDIYKATKTVEKSYIKGMRNSKISTQDVANNFIPFLDLAIKLADFQTDKVEQELKNLKDASDIEAYFLKIRLNEVN